VHSFFFQKKGLAFHFLPEVWQWHVFFGATIFPKTVKTDEHAEILSFFFEYHTKSFQVFVVGLVSINHNPLIRGQIVQRSLWWPPGART
jgi:hypothetical protein